MPKGATLAQALAELFDISVGVGVTDPNAPQPPLLAGEDALLARAVPKRRREFAAGRDAARRAMAQLGQDTHAILPTINQGPIWPDGLRGSISHSDSLCVAAVTTAPFHIGVDVEPATALEADLMPEVLGANVTLTGPDAPLQAKRIFSAKEAAFKAQFPVSKMHFGFNVLDIRFEVHSNRFTAVFTQDIAPFAKGEKLHGRHMLCAGHFVTAVTLPIDA